MHRSASRLLAPLLAAAVTAAAIALPADAVAAGLGGFSVRPAKFDPNDPATRAYFKHTIPAGGSFGARVVVANTNDKPLDLLIYPVDGLTGATSGTVFANRQDPVRKAARWIQLHVDHVTVPARSQRELGFGVRAPDGAKPGDHVAGIAIEDAHPRTSGGRFSITQVVRAVVGVKVTIDGDASSAMSLKGPELKPLPGTKVSSVVLAVSNTGGTLCKPKLRVTLAGSGRPRTVRRTLDTVLPGDTIPYPLPWPHALGKGAYRVDASATGCGDAARVSGTASLKQPLTGAGDIEAAVIAQAPAPAKQQWWPIAVVGVAGIAAGLGLNTLRRRIRLRKAGA
jgi:hypothetical protein